MTDNICPVCGMDSIESICPRCEFNKGVYSDNPDVIESFGGKDEYLKSKESNIRWHKLSWMESEGFVLSVGTVDELFYYAGSAEKVVVPEGMRVIHAVHDYSRENKTIKQVILPSSVVSVSSYSFANCMKLETVVFPQVLASLGEAVFSGCKALRAFEMPTGIASIPSRLFYDCTKLRKVTLPGMINSVGERAFCSCGSLGTVELPDTVESIGASAFLGCASLRKVDIPELVTVIEEGTFMYCSNLAKATLPSRLKAIKEDAFCFCEKLAEMALPNGITEIGNRAFCETELREIFIPQSVAYMGEGVFDGCFNLKYIYCEAPSKPNGWNDNWLGTHCNALVIWNS